MKSFIKGLKDITKFSLDDADWNWGFSQDSFLTMFEESLSENCKKYEKRFNGICLPLCLLVSELGIHHRSIKKMFEARSKDEKNALEDVFTSLDTYCDEILNNHDSLIKELEENNPLLFILDSKETAKLLQEENNSKKINAALVKAVLDRNDGHLQLYIFSESEIHTVLIYKEAINEKSSYYYFEPNKCLYKKSSLEGLCEEINSSLNKENATKLRLMKVDSFKSLLSSKYNDKSSRKGLFKT